MKNISITIPIGLGDLIYIKAALDSVSHQFSQIKLNFHRHIIASVGRDLGYNKFLDDIGQLFFSSPPYILDDTSHILTEHLRIYTDNRITPQKPELGHLLCKGTSLNLDCPYIVMTTKLRYFERKHFDKVSAQLWEAIQKLLPKYKVVILGEREVQMNKEYKVHTSEYIYSIYNDIKNNIPNEQLIDLTVSALGITSPTLTQIQQDCLIMKEAKFVITLGVGGNFCMATAVANTIGYRIDDEPIADMVFKKEYPNAIVTKNLDRFLNEIEKYV